MKTIVENYLRFKALLAELEGAMAEAHLPDSKKRLTAPPAIMPCLRHTAEALGELSALDADEKLLAVVMEDARATLGAVYRALCEDLRTPEAVRLRVVQIMTRLVAELPFDQVPAALVRMNAGMMLRKASLNRTPHDIR